MEIHYWERILILATQIRICNNDILRKQCPITFPQFPMCPSIYNFYVIFYHTLIKKHAPLIKWDMLGIAVLWDLIFASKPLTIVSMFAYTPCGVCFKNSCYSFLELSSVVCNCLISTYLTETLFCIVLRNS